MQMEITVWLFQKSGIKLASFPALNAKGVRIKHLDLLLYHAKKFTDDYVTP